MTDPRGFREVHHGGPSSAAPEGAVEERRYLTANELRVLRANSLGAAFMMMIGGGLALSLSLALTVLFLDDGALFIALVFVGFSGAAAWVCLWIAQSVWRFIHDTTRPVGGGYAKPREGVFSQRTFFDPAKVGGVRCELLPELEWAFHSGASYRVEIAECDQETEEASWKAGAIRGWWDPAGSVISVNDVSMDWLMEEGIVTIEDPWEPPWLEAFPRTAVHRYRQGRRWTRRMLLTWMGGMAGIIPMLVTVTLVAGLYTDARRIHIVLITLLMMVIPVLLMRMMPK